MKALLGDLSLLVGYAEKSVGSPGSTILSWAPSREKVEISPLHSEVKVLLGDQSLLVGYAQKVVSRLPGANDGRKTPNLISIP